MLYIMLKSLMLRLWIFHTLELNCKHLPTTNTPLISSWSQRMLSIRLLVWHHYIIIIPYRFQIIALLVIQVCMAQNGWAEPSRNRYPRPSDHSPGGRRFGEEHGWVYHQNEGYWYHPESMWRWHPNHGWREYGNNRGRY